MIDADTAPPPPDLPQALDPTRNSALLAEAPEAYAEMVQSVSSYGIYLISPRGIINSWNRGAARITGFPADKMIGAHYQTLFTEQACKAGVPQQILGTVKYGDTFRDDQDRLHARGHAFVARASVDMVRDGSGVPAGFVEVVQDVTADKQRETTLITKATRDALTGVANRGYFMELAEQAIKRALRERAPVSVAVLDIDHFKRVNDTWGHAAGDAAIKHVAALITRSIRDVDIFGRIGGEEFALVMPSANLHPAMLLCDRLRQALFDAPMRADALTGNKPVRLTASFGVVAHDPLISNVERMLKLADTALYAAKRNGRNRVEAWQE